MAAMVSMVIVMKMKTMWRISINISNNGNSIWLAIILIMCRKLLTMTVEKQPVMIMMAGVWRNENMAVIAMIYGNDEESK